MTYLGWDPSRSGPCHRRGFRPRRAGRARPKPPNRSGRKRAGRPDRGDGPGAGHLGSRDGYYGITPDPASAGPRGASSSSPSADISSDRPSARSLSRSVFRVIPRSRAAHHRPRDAHSEDRLLILRIYADGHQHGARDGLATVPDVLVPSVEDQVGGLAEGEAPPLLPLKERGRGSRCGGNEEASRSTPPGELPGIGSTSHERCDLWPVLRLAFRNVGFVIAIEVRRKDDGFG